MSQADMWETFFISNKIENTIKLNVFINMLKIFPFCPKSWDCNNYALKNKLTLIAMCFKILEQILSAVFGFLIGICLPLYFIKNYALNISLSTAFYTLFIFLYLGMGSLTNITAFETSESRYISIRHFHMNPKSYFFSNLLMYHIWNLVGEFPVFIVGMLYFHIDLWLIFPLLITKEILGAFGEFLHIYYYQHRKKLLIKNLSMDMIVKCIFVVVGITFIFILRSVTIPFWVLLIISFISLMIGVYSIWKLWQFDDYKAIFLAVDKIKNLTFDSEEYEHKQDIKNVELKNKMDNHSIDNPYDWLTELFFERFKFESKRRITVLWAVSIVVAIGYILWYFFNRETAVHYGSFAMQHCSIVGIFIYQIVNSRKMIRLMFFECDSCMLRYNFYRTRKAIVFTYISRLIKMILCNFNIAIPVSLCFVLIGWLTQTSVSELICVILFIQSVAIFAAVNYLFLYYFFEPFSKETSIIKPGFHIAEYTTMMIVWAFLGIKNVFVMTILLIILTLIYVVVSIFVIAKYGEKRFVLW